MVGRNKLEAATSTLQEVIQKNPNSYEAKILLVNLFFLLILKVSVPSVSNNPLKKLLLNLLFCNLVKKGIPLAFLLLPMVKPCLYKKKKIALE